MSERPDLSTPELRHAYALESDRMAKDLWRLVGNPFKLLQWRREAKIVRERIALLNDALDRS